MQTPDIGGLQQSIGALTLLSQDSNQHLFANRCRDPHFANGVLLDNRTRSAIGNRAQACGSEKNQNAQQQNQLRTQRYPSAMRFDAAGLNVPEPTARAMPPGPPLGV